MKTKPNDIETAPRSRMTVTNQICHAGKIMMKSPVLILLSTIAITQAAIIPFDLSPPGTDAAVGLRPANQVPAVTNSTGSGNEISGGISFDTANSTLTFRR